MAGEAQIDFAGRGEQVEVATFPTEPFSSYFSGNTVQICPVGALTATPYRFTARAWDLDQEESTCTGCSVGCRVATQSSSNRLTRLLGIDSDPVNHGWLCDKGRFAFESVNGDEVASGPLPSELADAAVDVAPATAAQVVGLGVSRGQFLGEARETGRFEHGRLVEPRVRKSGELVAVSWGEALAAAAAGLQAAQAAGGPGAVAVIGGARLTNESAYAWAKLAKGVLGTDSVDAQLGDGLPADLVLGLPRATIDTTCAAPVLITLAGDLREELPVLFLRLREAVIAGSTLIEISPTPTPLTPLAAARLPIRPGDAPLVAQALAGEAGAPASCALHPRARPSTRTCSARPGRAGSARRRGTAWPSSSAVRRTPSRARWWPRRPACSPPPCRRRPSSRRSAGATSSALSTWAWPPVCCRAGSASRPGASGSARPGARCPRRPASTPPPCSRPWRASHARARCAPPFCWARTR